MRFEQGASHFHSALGPAIYEAFPTLNNRIGPYGGLALCPTCTQCLTAICGVKAGARWALVQRRTLPRQGQVACLGHMPDTGPGSTLPVTQGATSVTAKQPRAEAGSVECQPGRVGQSRSHQPAADPPGRHRTAQVGID